MASLNKFEGVFDCRSRIGKSREKMGCILRSIGLNYLFCAIQNSWTGRIEIIGYESHDTGLALESLSDGFWLDNALIVCQTGERISMPSSNGFFWYDLYQEHIITRETFRNCGYRSNEFNQYHNSARRGCGDDPERGCRPDSTTFGFLSHSDKSTPQIMQGTKQIAFDKCGG